MQLRPGDSLFGNEARWERWSQRAPYLFVLLVATILIISFYFIFQREGYLNAYQDGMSKLNLARRVIDNPYGEFRLAHIGTVWLPLTSILMLPTIWIDPLWSSGLSGIVPSMLFFVATAVILFEIVRTLTGSKLGGLVATAIAMLNLNLLYFGVTPMAESLLVASISFVALSLIRLEQEPRSTSRLLVATAAIAISSMTRYETWFLTVVVAVPLTFVALWSKGIRGWEIISRVLTIFIVPAFLMSCWIFYVYLMTGDPLSFSHGPYSAKYKDVIVLQYTEAWGHLDVAIDRYWGAVKLVINDAFLLLAVIGLGFYLVRLGMRRERIVSTSYLLGIPAFYISSLYMGQNSIADLVAGDWLNIRYGLTVIVLVAVMVGYPIGVAAASRLPVVKWTGRALSVGAVALLGFVSVPEWNAPAEHTAVLIGYPKRYDLSDPRLQVANWLSAHYDGGKILVDLQPPPSDPMVYMAGIPLREFISDNSPVGWRIALDDPAAHVDWLLIGRPGDRVDQSLQQMPDPVSTYALVFDNSHAVNGGRIYIRRDRLKHLVLEDN